MKKVLSTVQAADKPYQDQIVGIHDDFTLEVCMNNKSRQDAFAVRYRAYLQAGMIPECENGLFCDAYDDMENVRIFLVRHQGRPVATVRSCIYSDHYDWAPTEAVQHFQKELSEKVGATTRLLESNRFAVDPGFQGRQSLFARLLLFRGHSLNSALHQCAYIITSVQANHVAFYRRFVGLEPISEHPRYYEWLDVDGLLLINRTDQCLASVLKRGMPDYNQDDLLRFAMCAYLPLIDSERKVA